MSERTDQSRRKAVCFIGASVVSVPMLGLVGCNSGYSGATQDLSSSNALKDDSSPSSRESNTESAELSWATGGTQSLKADFPNDDIFQNASSCSLAVTGQLMEGPCYFQVAQKTSDISEGLAGLPMQLCLKVVDENCQPLSNAEVEVWHCDNRGVYSAGVSGSKDSSRFAADFCSGGDAKAQTSQWFRGRLLSDASGRVNFKSCLPGWYPGRCIHIHFRVRHQGRETLTSQLAFSDALADEIYTSHPAYADRGKQDTSLRNDGVFRKNYATYVMDYRKNFDGSLLAYKVLQLEM